MLMKCEHEIQCCGARVKICGENVRVVSEPSIIQCPLHESLYGFKKIDKEAVKKTVEAKMKLHGLCCRNRDFDDSPVVAYGASEMIKVCIESRLLDCAVVVCDGAGTVITPNSSLVQGIGARLTGIVKTSPIPAIIKHLETNNGVVLDPASAEIDQLKGVRKGAEMGYSGIAVTVAGFQAEQITKIRRVEKKLRVDATIFSVCNTCVTEDAIEHIVNADVVCASASEIVRQQIGPRAVMQLGVTIPIFAVTERGKKTMLTYLSKFNDKTVVFRTCLPYMVEKRGPTLKT